MKRSLIALIFGMFFSGISLYFESNNTYMIMSSIWIVGSLILKEIEDKE